MLKYLASKLMGFATSDFSADVYIINNTDYVIASVVSEDSGRTSFTVQPGKTYSWTSDQTNNTESLVFGDGFMQGGIAFGPTSGVWADRGWQQDQTISMTINANGTIWTQKTNGGKEVLQWNQFMSGGRISVEFNKL